jgi:serine/threonine-protein kinase
VILYEMLTGERPFTGQSVTTIIYKIVNENPIPPRELDVSIHPGLSMIVTKCLAKDPDERYQEASDLATALKSYRLMSAPEPAAYSTMPMNVASSTGTMAKPWQVPPPPKTGQIPATSPKTNPGMRSGTGVQPVAPDDPTMVGSLPTAQPANPAARRNWAIFGIAALAIVMVAGALKSRRHGPETPATQATTQVPATDQSSVPSMPTPNAAQTAPTPPAPASPEDKIEQAANEIAAKAQKSAADAQQKAAKLAVDVPAAAVGDLRITSTPPGAKVIIDGVSQDYYVTPFNSPPLKAGTHSLVANIEGFPGQVRQVEVVPRKRTAIDFQLSGDKAIYNITSAPVGAEILIDGAPSGSRTPAQLPLKAGKHKVGFKLEGFQTAELETESTAGESVNLAPRLLARNSVDITGPPPPDQPSLGTFAKMRRFMTGGPDIPVGKGVMQIRTRPKGATITVDGIDARRVTPFKFPMHPGTYSVVISKEGFTSVTRTVKVEEGKVAEVEAILLPAGK